MASVTISEFQELTHLSDSSLLWLLKEGRLACQVDAQGKLLVDLAALDNSKLIRALIATRKASYSDAEEQLAKKIAAQFLRVVSDSLPKA